MKIPTLVLAAVTIVLELLNWTPLPRYVLKIFPESWTKERCETCEGLQEKLEAVRNDIPNVESMLLFQRQSPGNYLHIIHVENQTIISLLQTFINDDYENPQTSTPENGREDDPTPGGS